MQFVARPVFKMANTLLTSIAIQEFDLMKQLAQSPCAVVAAPAGKQPISRSAKQKAIAPALTFRPILFCRLREHFA